MILDAKCDMRVTDPKVHLRVHQNTPDEIWEKAAYLNSLGMGFPTYENGRGDYPRLHELSGIHAGACPATTRRPAAGK